MFNNLKEIIKYYGLLFSLFFFLLLSITGLGLGIYLIINYTVNQWEIVKLGLLVFAGISFFNTLIIALNKQRKTPSN